MIAGIWIVGMMVMIFAGSIWLGYHNARGDEFLLLAGVSALWPILVPFAAIAGALFLLTWLPRLFGEHLAQKSKEKKYEERRWNKAKEKLKEYDCLERDTHTHP